MNVMKRSALQSGRGHCSPRRASAPAAAEGHHRNHQSQRASGLRPSSGCRVISNCLMRTATTKARHRPCARVVATAFSAMAPRASTCRVNSARLPRFNRRYQT